MTEYVPIETFEPWTEDLGSSSDTPTRKIVHGLFGKRYWYETLVNDMPAVTALVFATVQAMKRQERYREHPPEVLMQGYFNPRPDLDEIRHQMDYYDYDSFRSGEL